MTRILAACSPGEVRVAAVTGGVLTDYAIWRPGRPDGVGDVYRGRVVAHVPALAGAFIALVGADGFLPDSEGGARLPEGTVVTVRVTRAPQGGKGPRLTAKLPQTEGPAGLLSRGPGAVELLAAQYPQAPVLADDPSLVAALRPVLGDRIAVRPSVWDAELAEQIESLAQPELALPGGARASIHPTPAVVAIDLDTAAASADRRSKPAAQLATNRAAIPALARQIRLRNLSGAIVIDLAGLSLRHRATLGPCIEAALAADPLRPRFLGFSALGLAEILRPRVHPPLHEVLVGPHAAGLAALRQMARDSTAAPHAALALRATPEVVSALHDDPLAVQALADRTGRPMLMQPDPALAPCAWHFERRDLG